MGLEARRCKPEADFIAAPPRFGALMLPEEMLSFRAWAGSQVRVDLPADPFCHVSGRLGEVLLLRGIEDLARHIDNRVLAPRIGPAANS